MDEGDASDRSRRARDTSNRGFRHFYDKTALCSSFVFPFAMIDAHRDAIGIAIDALGLIAKIICAA